MSSVTVTENNNKVSVDKTTNVVTVTSPGTVGPQGGSGTIDSATATATEVAVDGAGASGDPTATITLGGTASARTMAFAFGVPTGASGVIQTINTTGTDGIEVDSGALMNSAVNAIQLGINAQTLWTHILGADVTGTALTVSDGSNTSPIALEGTITFTAVANETTVVEDAGAITIGLVDNPVVSGATAGNVRIGVTGDNEVDTTSGNLTLDSAGGTVAVDDNLTVAGNLTVSGTTTTLDSTVTTIVDPIMVLQSVAGGGALLGDTNKDVGLILQYHTGSANKTAFLGYDDSAGKLTFIPDATISSEVTSGTVGTMVVDIEGDVTGAVTGNADTATALATTRTIGGVSFDGTGNINLPGVNTAGNQDTSGTATTATTATNVTVADESSDTTCFPLFVTAATGGLPPRSGTNLTFNSSTGVLTATGFAGPITGAVTGNASTATALASGRTIGCTGDVVWTSASFDGSGNVTGTATIQANSVTMGTDTTGNYVATVTAGTGLTSTGATSGESIAHSLSVDAAQTQITSVGTIGTGTWQGTAVAQTYIADQAINEAKMQVSNAPTNGYVLTARSGDTGGMTWEDLSTLVDPAGTAVAMSIALG